MLLLRYQSWASLCCQAMLPKQAWQLVPSAAVRAAESSGISAPCAVVVRHDWTSSPVACSGGCDSAALLAHRRVCMSMHVRGLHVPGLHVLGLPYAGASHDVLTCHHTRAGKTVSILSPWPVRLVPGHLQVTAPHVWPLQGSCLHRHPAGCTGSDPCTPAKRRP